MLTSLYRSTGLPKGVKRTWKSLSAQGNLHKLFDRDDVILTALPIFVISNLGQGTTSVLPCFNPTKPADFNPIEVLNQMRDLSVTSALGSPSFFERLIPSLKSGEKLPEKFSKLYTGGAPVFKPLALSINSYFRNVAYVVYG